MDNNNESSKHCNTNIGKYLEEKKRKKRRKKQVSNRVLEISVKRIQEVPSEEVTSAKHE